MRKLPIRRAFLFLLLLCLLIFLGGKHLVEKYSKESMKIIYAYENSALVLNTPGCKIPNLDPFDESVRKLIVLKQPYVCEGKPNFMVTQANATIVLNETVLKEVYGLSPNNVSCSYQAIYRQHDPIGYVRETTISFGEKTKLQFNVPLGEEFLKVWCKLGKTDFTEFIPLVPIKSSVEKTKVENTRKDDLNVILIGIDSVSKLNFLRHFRRTYNFLTNNLSAFDMKGYTKVGDNTFPNLIPLLTGHFIEYYWNESVRNKMFFDHLEFIWKLYSSKGYRTFYTEDSVYTGTFQYLKRGFEDPPTDYYFRPFGLAITKSGLKRGYCLNSLLETEIMFRYLEDFLKTMDYRLSFSFTMVSTLTHDKLNDAGYADLPTYNLLKTLHTRGITNKSLVIVFSDHGIRFGPIRQTYVGKYEERMPMLFIALPEWFLRQNPNIAESLKENQNRLVTLFDVHATLYHLLNISKPISEDEKSTKTPNGLSLMSKISATRTCEAAKILAHWCPCQVYQYVSPNDKMAKKAAASIIAEINKELNPFKDRCFRLEIENITDARVGQANDKVLRFVNRINDVINKKIVYGEKIHTLSDFLVTLKVQPGGAIFEGTVRYDSEKQTFKPLDISRINQYGNQSNCINSQKLKKICYCK